MTAQSHLIKFRKELHSQPELSGQEGSTAARVKHFISAFKPDDVMDNIGGHGIAFIYRGTKPGSRILFRADLDALPIREISEHPYRSVFSDRAHLCGHDGHMTIMAGLAEALNNDRPLKGEIVLLFQPSEETGEGAARVLEDKKFSRSIHPDYVFALHNLPGFPRSSVIINRTIFSSASVGLTICLHGKSSHAAEPDKGKSPVKALSQIIDAVHEIQADGSLFSGFVLGTIIHINLGYGNMNAGLFNAFIIEFFHSPEQGALHGKDLDDTIGNQGNNFLLISKFFHIFFSSRAGRQKAYPLCH